MQPHPLPSWLSQSIAAILQDRTASDYRTLTACLDLTYSKQPLTHSISFHWSIQHGLTLDTIQRANRDGSVINFLLWVESWMIKWRDRNRINGLEMRCCYQLLRIKLTSQSWTNWEWKDNFLSEMLPSWTPWQDNTETLHTSLTATAYLMPLVTNSLSVFNEICKCSTRCIVSGVVCSSALVLSVAHYGLTVARYNYFTGSNAFVVIDTGGLLTTFYAVILICVILLLPTLIITWLVIKRNNAVFVWNVMY